MKRRRTMVGGVVLGLVLLAARHPTADVRVLTHSASDPAPVRVRAAVDLGLVGVSILYTWSRQLR